MMKRRPWVQPLLSGLALVYMAAPAAAEPVVIGYAAVFKGLEASTQHPDTSRYTHVNLAFANPDTDGAMVKGGALACFPASDGAMLTRRQLKEGVTALQSKGIKVSVSVAGGIIPQCSGDWAKLLEPSSRGKTVANLMALVDEAGLDGLDIDIEGVLLTAIDKAGNYTPFIAALSAELRRRGKLLTCATASYEGGMIPIASIPYFDFVNIMSYDAIGPTWGPAGAEHSTYEAAARDLALWRERGVLKGRLVLGVPFYGYGFGGYQPNWSYRAIAETHGAAASKADLIGRACAGCSYITFNSPETIRQKAALAARQAGGVMVWELSQDTDEGTLTGAVRAGLEQGR